jgi:hypothetical protein
MKKYLIVETWNGEGYSTENRITEVIEFESDEQAKEHCLTLAMEDASTAFYDEDEEPYKIEDRGNGHTFSDDVDAGSRQYFELTDECYGVMIFCNINEVSILCKEEYTKAVSDSFWDCDDIKNIDGDMDSKRLFFGTDEIGGDYDLQFEVIPSSDGSKEDDSVPADDLVYYSEGDGLEYEVWVDVKTDTKYNVPIDIVRDFDNATKI